ncbi:MAG: decaprenyl-phosphate phosphoribosyltransferase [Miltoncostaeaceae bacterium]
MTEAGHATAAPPSEDRSLAVLLVAAGRPRQWVKNGFVALPVLFAQRGDDPGSLLVVAAAIACFCAASSGVYLINDVLDRAEDRVHPSKRLRPVASGALSVRAALGAAGALLVAALAGGLLITLPFALTLVAYLAVTLTYTVWLKHQVLLDVMAIAAGFVLRVVGGAAAIAVRPSDWILICTGLLALMLGFAKRRGEVLALAGGGADHRRVLADYSVPFLDAMLYLTAGVTVVSYAVYTTTGAPGEAHLVATVPFVLYGVIRYLWLAISRDQGESPTAVIWEDRPLQVCVIAWAALSAVLLATMGGGG